MILAATDSGCWPAAHSLNTILCFDIGLYIANLFNQNTACCKENYI